MIASAEVVDSEALLGMMRKRRVTRQFTSQAVPIEVLQKIVEAGRWATSGGNRYPHRFLVVRDPHRISLVRAASPGMLWEPPALIIIMLDTEQSKADLMDVDPFTASHIDVGTAALSMLTMVQSLGLGACPVTSFSKSGVSAMLELPSNLTPEFILILGYPLAVTRVINANAPKPITVRDLTFWEFVGSHDPKHGK